MKYHRKSIRLKGYDYSQSGLYFITINTYKDQYLFGMIENGKMILNDIGEMIEKSFPKIEKKYNIKCDDYVIMPNHVHFIVEILGKEREGKGREDLARTMDANGKIVEAGFSCLDYDDIPRLDSDDIPKINLGNIIGYFKYMTTKNYNNIIERNSYDYLKIWHRNYYEHIIRNEKEYKRIANYIKNNPKNWKGAILISPMDFINEEF